jgi:hypothetical protein
MFRFLAVTILSVVKEFLFAEFILAKVRFVFPIESKNNFLPPPRGRIKVGGKGPGCPPLSEPEAL